MQNRPNVVVMGDLIEDTDVVSSIPNPENVLTVGFLNEKVLYIVIITIVVLQRLHDYKSNFNVHVM